MYKLANLSFVLQAKNRRFVSTNVSLCLRSGLETLKVQKSNLSNSRPPEGVARKSGIPTHTHTLAQGHSGGGGEGGYTAVVDGFPLEVALTVAGGTRGCLGTADSGQT